MGYYSENYNQTVKEVLEWSWIRLSEQWIQKLLKNL